MRKYELAIVIDGQASAAKKKSVSESISKLIKILKGKVTEVEELKKRSLAYPIAKKTSGNYLFFTVELEPEAAKNIDAKLRLEKDILRYLLVRKL